MTSDAGVPGAPRFDVVLRGYDRRQVDEHVDRLQRVLARMRADLEMVRSQPAPAAPQARPAAGPRPRPTPRPRPGAGPDTIGDFTDRMESILAEAEAEAAEIRRNAHAAARAQTDGVRSQVADLVRQRDAVLGELTRMRSQLEGMLAAPTTQMSAREPAGRSSAGRFDTGAPHTSPSGRPFSPPADQFRGPTAPPPAPQAVSLQQTTPQMPPAQPCPPAPPVSPSKEAVSPSKEAVSPSKEAVSPSKDAVSPSKDAVSPSKDAVSPSKGAVSPPAVSPQAVSRQAVSPSKDGGSSSRNGSSAVPGTSASTPASSAGSSSTPKPDPTPPADKPAAAARPEREAGKAAHRLPTGAYPAVAESSSLHPRTDPQIEPADLFRPKVDGQQAEPRTTAVPPQPPTDNGAPREDRTATVRDERPAQQQPTKAGSAEATTVVGAVRPDEPTVRAKVPGAVSRPEKKDDAANGDAQKGPRTGSSSRSA